MAQLASRKRPTKGVAVIQNTAARRMIATAGASSSQGSAHGSDYVPDGFDRPVAAERSVDAAAEPTGAAGAGGIDENIKLIQSICREMEASGEACVLLTGADPGFMPARYHPPYRAGRANVSSFSWVLKDELKGTGVTAICALPRMDDADYFDHPEEPVTRVVADVSNAWHMLHAAMTAATLWVTSLTGIDRG